MKTPKLSVITVTYNNQSTIEKYLDSLESYLPDNSEVIVVDNLSTDETRLKLLANTRVKLIESDTNLGFGHGCNLATRIAKGDYLLILNPDAELKPDTIEKLLHYLEDNPDVGLMAPRLVLNDGQTQPSVTKLPTIGRAIKEYWLGRSGEYREYEITGNQPMEVEAAYGAAWLLKRSLFEQLKGFGDQFFMYYEDLDFCRRLRKIGQKIVYLPTAEVIHQLGVSARTVKVKNLPFGLRTLALFIPIKGSGSAYFQVQSGIRYFGFMTALVIRLIIFSGQKFGLARR